MARAAEQLQSEQQPLFETEKADCLSLAVNSLPGQTNATRTNLERLIALCEGKTFGVGPCCELTRAEICGQLRWGPTKLRETRRLATALGWIEVLPSVDPDGGQSANQIRVCWDKIRRDAHATPLAKNATPLAKNATRLAKNATLATPANKEVNHDHDHEVLKNSNSHDHNHPGGAQRAPVGDAKLPHVTPAKLNDLAWIDALRPRAVANFGLPDSEVGAFHLHSMARQALAGNDPGALFREMLRNRGWTLPPGAKFSIAAWAEDEARSLLASQNRAVPRARLPPEPTYADPDAALAASHAAHIRAAEQLAEKFAVR